MSEDNTHIDTSQFVKRADFEAFALRVTTAIESIGVVVDTKIQAETKARKQDIQSVRNDLVPKIESISEKLDNLTIAITKLTTQMESRREIEETEHRRLDERNEEQDKQLVTQLVDLRATQANMRSIGDNQNMIESGMTTLRHTIHGDKSQKDGAPSVFGMIGSLTVSLNQYRDNSIQANNTLTEIVLDAVDTIDTLKMHVAVLTEELKLAAQLWQRRRASARGFITKNWLKIALITGGFLTGSIELRTQVVQDLIGNLWE